jgi:hypothetical protein
MLLVPLRFSFVFLFVYAFCALVFSFV